MNYTKPKKHFAFTGHGFNNDFFVVQYYSITDDDDLIRANGGVNWLPVNSWKEADIAEICINPKGKQLHHFAVLLLEVGAFIRSLGNVADYTFIDFDDKDWACNSIYVYKYAGKCRCHPGDVKREKTLDTAWDETRQLWI